MPLGVADSVTLDIRCTPIRAKMLVCHTIGLVHEPARQLLCIHGQMRPGHPAGMAHLLTIHILEVYLDRLSGRGTFKHTVRDMSLVNKSPIPMD